MNKKSFDLLNDQIYDTIQKLAEMREYSVKQIENLQLNERFLELSNVAQLIIMEHQRLSSQILNNVENAITGKISKLIPLEILTKDIGKLAQMLEDNQRMPIDIQQEDILHIFKFSTTRAALIKKNYLYQLSKELNIHCIDQSQYQLKSMKTHGF